MLGRVVPPRAGIKAGALRGRSGHVAVADHQRAGEPLLHLADQRNHRLGLRRGAAVKADVRRCLANAAFIADANRTIVFAAGMCAHFKAPRLAQVAARFNGPVFADEIVIADLVEPARAVHRVDVCSGVVVFDGRGRIVDHNPRDTAVR